MINQLMNREFLLDQLRQIQKYMTLPSEERRRGERIPAEAKDISEDDRRQALEAVTRTLTTEMSGQNPSASRRGGEPPLDDWSFFSRDPVISNLQTVLDYYFVDGPGRLKVKIQPARDVDRRGLGEMSLTGYASLAGFDPQASDGRRLFNKFSVTDLEWVSTGLAAGLRLARGRHEFIERAPTMTIGEQARLVMVGDWGSGLPRAQQVAQHMRVSIERGLAENREVHVVHLGDVYYSGWQREYEQRFLPYWPVKLTEANHIRSWSLNGNHDMYSGGFGYYDVLLKDPRFAAQTASYFCLEHKHWQIFGLDSSWEDEGLKDPQAEWIKGKLDPDKKTMLLTHHQPFSSYEKPAKGMADKLRPIWADNKPVQSWFWGHEHRFMLFNDHDYVRFGRLIGHGGVPVYMTHKENDAYPPPGLFEDRRFMKRLSGLEHWAYFGFSVLDFVEDRIEVQYIDEDGNNTHAGETII